MLFFPCHSLPDNDPCRIFPTHDHHFLQIDQILFQRKIDDLVFPFYETLYLGFIAYE